MTNYICINGQKAELTEEQLKALGIELPKVNPFERVKNYDDERTVYFINSMGNVQSGWCDNNSHYNVGNYCTDKSLMKQRALHETLNRLLWRYSMEHDGDKIDWNNDNQPKYYIYCDHCIKKYSVDFCRQNNRFGCVHFTSHETANNAIKEIIDPFMKAHPEFKW